MEIQPLKAAHGDAIIIKFSSNHRQHIIVIDGGPSAAAENIADIYDALDYIDLLILTHYDEDHISGLLEYFSRHKKDKVNRVGQVWVNGTDLIYYDDEENTTAYDNAFCLTSCLNNLQKQGFISRWVTKTTNSSAPVITETYRIDILSPTDEILKKMEKEFKDYVEEHGLQDETDTDTEVSFANVIADSKMSLDDLSKKAIKNKTSFMNCTSIAFLLQVEGKRVLFMGDADSDIVSDALVKLHENDKSIEMPLYVNLIKVSHHGSKANIRKRFLDLTDCQNYLFTTNGGSGGSYHPDRTTIAYLWKYSKYSENKKLTLYFNYPLTKIEERNIGLLTFDEMNLFNIVDSYEDNSFPTITI